MQIALVALLKAQKAKAKDLFAAELELARRYSEAHDFSQAEAIFAQLSERAGRVGLNYADAQLNYYLGRHYLVANRAQQGANKLEEAIKRFEQLKLYSRAKAPPEAYAAVNQVGDIYLNRLSAPREAQKAYQRALGYARSKDQEVRLNLALARVARRTGEFKLSTKLSKKARSQALEQTRPDLALSALIETSNGDWYRGDYQGGLAACQESLREASALRRQVVTGKYRPKTANARITLDTVDRLKIYGLSACGLIHMSLQHFAEAVNYLQQALDIAQAQNNLSEQSAQHNNLGRVYSEFADFEKARNHLLQAQKIDRILQDRYALAYDLKNLGQVYRLDGQEGQAKQVLQQALKYSEAVKDGNSELRVVFGLAELERQMGAFEQAQQYYLRAAPLAKKLGVVELSWKIERALGLLARNRSELGMAEKHLKTAIRQVGRVRGRAQSSRFGPSRIAPYDDLIELLIGQKRFAEAWLLSEKARAWRVQETISEVSQAEPGPSKLYFPSSAEAADRFRKLQGQLSPGAVVAAYWLSYRGLASFWMSSGQIEAHFQAQPQKEVLAHLENYAEAMQKRLEGAEELRFFSTALLEPGVSFLKDATIFTVILSGPLKYLSVASLPSPGTHQPLLENYLIHRALGLETAVAKYRTGSSPKQLHLFDSSHAPGRKPLPLAQLEVQTIGEDYPAAQNYRFRQVSPGSFAEALQQKGSWVHFAGHAQLSESSRTVGGGGLVFADGFVGWKQLLPRAPVRAELLVLSACQTLRAREALLAESYREFYPLEEGLRETEVRWLIASLARVDDVSSAILMKYFYRQAKDKSIPEAFQKAQLQLRKKYPHPAWWANFVLLRVGD